jgi:dephospho-CoA kinase
MKLFGLTGGVGMGKSTCADLLRARNISMIDTDELARELVEPNQPALRAIQTSFGEHLLDPEGRLRREHLARIVFADADQRKRLESILHPLIRERWVQQTELWRKEGRPAAAVIIPLLFETEAAPHFDRVICLACSAPTQRQRLLERGWNVEQVEQRIQAQWPVARKIELADYVIWTESDLATHAVQLDRILAGEGLRLGT